MMKQPRELPISVILMLIRVNLRVMITDGQSEKAEGTTRGGL